MSDTSNFSECSWKGHVVNALRLSGYSSDMIKKVLKNLDKSIVAVPKEEAEAIYAKTKLS